MGAASKFHLSFGDHVHKLNAGKKDSGTAKRFESQHGPCASLDRPMILLDNVVQVLVLPNLDRGITLGVDGVECGQIGPARVDRYGFGFTVLAIDFSK